MQFGLFHIYNSLSFITEIERHSKGLKRQTRLYRKKATRLYRERAWVLKHSPRHAKAAFRGGFVLFFSNTDFFYGGGLAHCFKQQRSAYFALLFYCRVFLHYDTVAEGRLSYKMGQFL